MIIGRKRLGDYSHGYNCPKDTLIAEKTMLGVPSRREGVPRGMLRAGGKAMNAMNER